MTNEEAIKILYNIRAYYASLTAGYPAHDCYGLGDMKCSDICKALLRGIRLLKQEPILDKIRAEIEEWYWQTDKQALTKDPCIVDTMVDLFIRMIDKYQVQGR